MQGNEQSAKGIRGYLLRMPDGELVFRVYTDATKKQYTDYKINHSDLAVEIVDDYSSLYLGDGDVPNSIDYPSRLKQGALSS